MRPQLSSASLNKLPSDVDEASVASRAGSTASSAWTATTGYTSATRAASTVAPIKRTVATTAVTAPVRASQRTATGTSKHRPSEDDLSTMTGGPTQRRWNSSHMYFPYILMGYVQLAFNTAIIIIMLYFAYQVVSTIQHDIDIKVDDYAQAITKEIELCSKHFLENKCAPHTRIPAIERSCIEWEKCIQRDPATMGRAKITAEIFAEIVNSFIEPISYKTMAFFVAFFFGFTIVGNYAFHFARSRVPEPPQFKQPAYMALAPQHGRY
ncbi:hypothetical protein, variant [Capsaspora owczarzaki ATCC 30864]|nr:hypothetical protein, variant [Capsaspora owczarzaki ATCC 30864]